MDAIMKALERLQRALPAEGGFAGGERFSIADCAVAPFLMRMMLFLRADLGAYTQEEGEKMRAAFAGDNFVRLRKYVEDLQERPGFKSDWDEVCYLSANVR